MIGTLQSLYADLGLGLAFDNLTRQLDSQRVTVASCLRLLLRARLLMAMRAQVVRLLLHLHSLPQQMRLFSLDPD